MMELFPKAVEIAPGIYQARGVGNASVVTTPGGNVFIDVGLPTEAEELKEKLDPVLEGPTTHIVVTHAHMDHVGGTETFREDGTEVIAHQTFPRTQRYLKALAPFFLRRNRTFYPESVPAIPDAIAPMALSLLYPTFEMDRLVNHEYEFEVGGTKFVVLHTPGAEGEDSVSVWLPKEKILFSGDFFGPLFPMFPNLYTIRGEKIRFAQDYIDSLDKIIALEPEMIVPSHFEPVTGGEQILADLKRMREAVQYVHDETVDGMNEGQDLPTLMREIQLPEHLDLSEGHGKVSWSVRAIWEGYAGWFHFQNTTQLYAEPVSDVYRDIVELAGGPDKVTARARLKLDADQPTLALHLVDMALAADPDNEPALAVKLSALQSLAHKSGDENHSEVMWLAGEIKETQDQLGDWIPTDQIKP